MDRNTIYEKWLSIEFKGQNGRITHLFTQNEINKWEQIKDPNFSYYANYQIFYLESHKPSSIPNIKSTIYAFLISDPIKNTPLEDVTTKMLDDYFISLRAQTPKFTSFRNRVNYISGFWRYLFDKGVVDIVLDAQRYIADYSSPTNISSAKALTPKQVDSVRRALLNGSSLFPEYLEYLYVFDMLYYTDFEDAQIQDLSFSRNVNLSNGTIVYGSKKDQISSRLPNSVLENIQQLHKLGRLGKLRTVRQYTENMRSVFNSFGFENIHKSDIKLTRKKLFLVCPQCQQSYEATIDNWCAAEFLEDGSKWIICRECGNV